MNTEPITRFIKIKDVVTPYKTLEKASEEANDYDWMRACDNVHICQHGELIYPLILRNAGDALEIACGCPAWQFAHDNDGCKHTAAFLHRTTPPQKPITDTIARDLMAAGWMGRKGNLHPPEMTSDEADEILNAEPLPEPPNEDYTNCRNVTSDEDGEDNEGSDPVPDRAPKPTPPPEPGVITGTCRHCGKTFERNNETKIIKEHEATCTKRAKGSDITQTAPEQQPEETKMAETEKKTYTHPDGTEFESAEQLLDYVDMLKDGQAVAENKAAATFELAPMIKGIKPQMRERGRITIGKKGAPNASGRGRKTVRFDHFVFTTTDKDETTDDYILDDAMNERYGKDCREIPVRFLSDNITEIFHTSYMKYTASGLKLMGDGENWIQYNADGTRTYITDPNGDHGFLDDPDVKPHGILTVLVDGQEGVGSVYRWRTTGWNSINGMLASLALCSEIAKRSGGRIAFLPMMLVYSTKWVTPKGQSTKKKIPVITCEFRGTIEQLQERSRDAMQYLSSPDTPDVAQLASANMYDVDDETLEEQKDVAGEFAPGVE
jgi:hypothetical protein